MNKYTLYNPDSTSFAYKEDIGDNKASFTVEADDIGDEYHTMSELYDHRRALTKCLLESLSSNHLYLVYKSKKHSDGSMFNGYFVVGAELPSGQISYHYDLKYWDDFNIPELDNAPVYDGHTSQNVINRLLAGI